LRPGAPVQSASFAQSIRRRPRWLGAAVILIVLALASAALVGSRPAGTAQKRSDFQTVMQTLRTDLATCNAKASTAISRWRPGEAGHGWVEQAQKAAQAAARACAPGTDSAIFDLTLYSLPNSLLGLHLEYAVSCLGVWAQEDVAPAMRTEETLLANPGDRAATSAYQREASWAEGNLGAANVALRRAAGKLGVADFTPIQLTSIQAAGRLAQPT